MKGLMYGYTIFSLCCVVSATDGLHQLKSNLTVGPRFEDGETGIYVVPANSVDPSGIQKHCRYCDEQAMSNSYYAFRQDEACVRKRPDIGTSRNEYEKDNNLFPVCNVGTVPGCGPPPNMTITANISYIFCDTGISNTHHTVYFSCALVCNFTKTIIQEFYCNESLQWQQIQHEPEPCLVPTISPSPVPMPNKIAPLVIVAIVIACVVIAALPVGIVVWLCRRRIKSRRDKEDPEAPEAVSVPPRWDAVPNPADAVHEVEDETSRKEVVTDESHSDDDDSPDSANESKSLLGEQSSKQHGSGTGRDLQKIRHKTELKSQSTSHQDPNYPSTSDQTHFKQMVYSTPENLEPSTDNRSVNPTDLESALKTYQKPSNRQDGKNNILHNSDSAPNKLDIINNIPALSKKINNVMSVVDRQNLQITVQSPALIQGDIQVHGPPRPQQDGQDGALQQLAQGQLVAPQQHGPLRQNEHIQQAASQQHGPLRQNEHIQHVPQDPEYLPLDLGSFLTQADSGLMTSSSYAGSDHHSEPSARISNPPSNSSNGNGANRNQIPSNESSSGYASEAARLASADELELGSLLEDALISSERDSSDFPSGDVSLFRKEMCRHHPETGDTKALCNDKSKKENPYETKLGHPNNAENGDSNSDLPESTHAVLGEAEEGIIQQYDGLHNAFLSADNDILGELDGHFDKQTGFVVVYYTSHR